MSTSWQDSAKVYWEGGYCALACAVEVERENGKATANAHSVREFSVNNFQHRSNPIDLSCCIVDNVAGVQIYIHDASPSIEPLELLCCPHGTEVNTPGSVFILSGCIKACGDDITSLCPTPVS